MERRDPLCHISPRGLSLSPSSFHAARDRERERAERRSIETREKLVFPRDLCLIAVQEKVDCGENFSPSIHIPTYGRLLPSFFYSGRFALTFQYVWVVGTITLSSQADADLIIPIWDIEF